MGGSGGTGQDPKEYKDHGKKRRKTWRMLAAKDQELAAMQGKVTKVEQAHQQTEGQLVRTEGLQEALEAR